MAKATIRAEVAALYSLIPPLPSRSPSALNPFYEELAFSDPFSVAECPCEGDEGSPNCTMNEKLVRILVASRLRVLGSSLKMPYLSCVDTHHKVSEEAKWLFQMKCSPKDLVQLQNALWNVSASQPILEHGTKNLDSTSFSDLVEERYIDSFVVDICKSKSLDKAREIGKGFTVFFPSQFYNWMRSKQLKQVNDLQQILMQIYLPNHWRLMFVDLVNREMYFDNGL
ncbi:hypothetical protein pdam_00021351 [Pocillopora damicornis]|uniref:Ubiquitin-like protease family profile domain-containing protein n=1 Tax=Pocillopora damicornis TaxID=46731 RepID=A0A3M6UNP9_POCDA|nr:hypothetical protein pdam_00021351 [Pocillopora damicornis]